MKALIRTAFCVALVLGIVQPGSVAWAGCVDYGVDARERLTFDVEIDDLDTVGDLVYAVGPGGLTIVDLSGSSPVAVGSLFLSGEDMRVAVLDDYAYVTAAKSYLHPNDIVLYTVDVSVPEAPTWNLAILRMLDEGPYNFDVAAGGGSLWIKGKQTIHVFDLSAPGAPVQVGETCGVEGVWGNSQELLVPLGDYLYAAGTWSDGSYQRPGIFIFDLDPDGNPRDAGTDCLLPVSQFTDFENQYAGFYPISLTPMNGHQLVLSRGLSDNTAVEPSSLYILELANNPERPRILDSLVSEEIPNLQSWGMVAQGNYLYGQQWNSYWDIVPTIVVYDVSDPRTMGPFDEFVPFDPDSVGSSIFGWYGVGATRNWIVWGGRVGSETDAKLLYQEPQCDPPLIVAPESAYAALTVPTLPNADPRWTFVWYTENWTDPAFDEVSLLDGDHPDSDCDIGTLQVNGTSPGVTANIVYESVNDRYRHVFHLERTECIEGCEYQWTATSSRAAGLAVLFNVWDMGTLTIESCPENNPPSSSPIFRKKDTHAQMTP